MRSISILKTLAFGALLSSAVAAPAPYPTITPAPRILRRDDDKSGGVTDPLGSGNSAPDAGKGDASSVPLAGGSPSSPPTDPDLGIDQNGDVNVGANINNQIGINIQWPTIKSPDPVTFTVTKTDHDQVMIATVVSTYTPKPCPVTTVVQGKKYTTEITSYDAVVQTIGTTITLVATSTEWQLSVAKTTIIVNGEPQTILTTHQVQATPRPDRPDPHAQPDGRPSSLRPPRPDDSGSAASASPSDLGLPTNWNNNTNANGLDNTNNNTLSDELNGTNNNTNGNDASSNSSVTINNSPDGSGPSKWVWIGIGAVVLLVAVIVGVVLCRTSNHSSSTAPNQSVTFVSRGGSQPYQKVSKAGSDTEAESDYDSEDGYDAPAPAAPAPPPVRSASRGSRVSTGRPSARV